MSYSRVALLSAALLLMMHLPSEAAAAERSYGDASRTAQTIRGTWYSKEGSLTFKEDGTIIFKGKRYFYAVTNGGLIQLSGSHSSNAIPYRLSGDKLILTIDGEQMTYLRTRPHKK